MTHSEHAPRGGVVGENERYYRGGEFVPFYKPRALMPQVNDKAYPQLIAWCSFMGITVTQETVAPHTLTPHQLIDVHKASAIPPEVMVIPLLVSADSFILDGNHRWYEHVQANALCHVLRLGLPFDDAIAALFTFLQDTPNGTLRRERTLANPDKRD